MPQNIIFDVGLVLIDWDPDRVYGTYFPDKADLKKFYAETKIFELNKEFDKGLSFAAGLKALSAEYPHYADPILYWQTRWTEMIGGPMEESIAILKKLHGKNYPLYAITNWSAETFPYVLKKYDFFTCFRDIVVSGKVNAIKPYPEIYQILLSRNNLQAHECLFIDDNIDNVTTANRLGMHAIHFTSPQQLQAELIAVGVV